MSFLIPTRKILLPVIALATAVLPLSCADTQRDNTIVITVEQLHRLAADSTDIFVLDVRTGLEYRHERLPFADLQVPYDSLRYLRKHLPTDTAATLYVFCRTGRRSDIATRILPELGYHAVINVAGGIQAWKAAGYTTVTGPVEN